MRKTALEPRLKCNYTMLPRHCDCCCCDRTTGMHFIQIFQFFFWHRTNHELDRSVDCNLMLKILKWHWLLMIITFSILKKKKPFWRIDDFFPFFGKILSKKRSAIANRQKVTNLNITTCLRFELRLNRSPSLYIPQFSSFRPWYCVRAHREKSLNIPKSCVSARRKSIKYPSSLVELNASSLFHPYFYLVRRAFSSHMDFDWEIKVAPCNR